MVFKVCIDPGHGGSNVGTVHGDLIEKDVTLEIAKKVLDSLDYNEKEIALQLTRNGDKTLSQNERGKISKRFKADLVISIHVNSSVSPYASGITTYHYPSNQSAATIGSTICKAAPVNLSMRAVSHSIPAVNNPKDPTDDWMINAISILEAHTAMTVLVEAGFASNKVDREILMKPHGQACIANAIRAGIMHAYYLHKEKE